MANHNIKIRTNGSNVDATVRFFLYRFVLSTRFYDYVLFILGKRFDIVEKKNV